MINSVVQSPTYNLPIIGLAFVFAFLMGRFAKKANLPKVTAYIMVGIILGPTVLNWITPNMADDFQIITEVAFGLILFNIGGEFHRGLFKRLAMKHILHSLYFSFFIFLFASTINYLFGLTFGFTQPQLIAYSLILGTIAIAAAPPTTLIVIKELDSEGPLTHLIMVFLAIGTVVTLSLSKILTVFLGYLGIWNKTDQNLTVEFLRILWSLGGSVIIGFLLGFLISILIQKEKKQGEILLGIICTILLGQTLAHYMGLEPLIISLFIGFAVVNVSPTGIKVHTILKDSGTSIYAFFFILAGTHVHLQTQIKTVGILGAGYILSRIVGIFLSSKIAAKLANEPQQIGSYMGPAVFSHAGAALAIAMTLKIQQDLSAQTAMTVVIGSIFFFEIIGPLTLRHSLISIGEIQQSPNIASGIKKVSFSISELISLFLTNVGITKITTEDSKINKTIFALVNKDFITIDKSATYTQVKKFINDHHYPIYTVVNGNDDFIGTITIEDLKRAKGKFGVPSTMSAKELASCKNFLREDSTFCNALDLFEQLGVSALPVLNKKNDKLIGFLYYKDVVLI